MANDIGDYKEQMIRYDTKEEFNVDSVKSWVISLI